MGYDVYVTLIKKEKTMKTYLLRIVRAYEQVDTYFDSKEAVMAVFDKCEDLAMVFEDGAIIAYN
jgi:hypothetical protein